ncbi:hypothetical protein MJL33_28670, partial [Salmonella enterica subsp. enterica serovar Kentucky]|nr:hypothetical protein [Salmonella enterica subsp. enterica serovar Kentucky]
PLVFQKELYAGISFASAVLYIALQHYVMNPDVVVISTLLFGFMMSLSALTGLLSRGAQSLSADNMNNAAGILQYCAKQKLASATN